MANIKLLIQFIAAIPSIIDTVKKLIQWQRQQAARREEEAAKKHNEKAAREMQSAIDANDIEAQKIALKKLLNNHD